jgi:cytochrome subunit of sulfide dehydrogenase
MTVSMTVTGLATSAALTLAVIGAARAAGEIDAPPGASSCTGCHATARTVETSVPRLIGRNPAELTTALQGFKSGQRPGTVMDRLAKGFTDDELKAIAAWFGAQKD